MIAIIWRILRLNYYALTGIAKKIKMHCVIFNLILLLYFLTLSLALYYSVEFSFTSFYFM